MEIKKLPHNHGKLPAGLLAEMPGKTAFENVADVFRMVSDGNRVQLFWLLCHCEECVADLSALMGLSSPALSHHLRILKNAGLIVSHREGREVRYTAATTPRAQAFHALIEDTVELSCPTGEEIAAAAFDSRMRDMTDIRDYMLSDLSRRETVDQLAARFHINRTTLKNEFKRAFGAPPAAYLRNAKMKKAMELLRTTDMALSEIATAVGYASQNKFTEAFRDASGVSPREYRALYRSGEQG